MQNNANTFPAKNIMIEGNIGAGKTTFLRMIMPHIDARIIFEPVEKWQNNDASENILNLFYKDISRWAYTFQTYVFISRIKAFAEQLTQATPNAVNIMERSVYCDRYCFAKNCYESGFLNTIEWNMYKEWFAWLAQTSAPQPSGFIYLQTTPEICFNRIAKRNRSEENSISINYLTALHGKHEDWLIHKKEIINTLIDVPVLVIDCTVDFEHNISLQHNIIDQVNAFINELSSHNNKNIPKQTSSQL